MNFSLYPDRDGKFKVPDQRIAFGGRYVPEVLMPALEECAAFIGANRRADFFESRSPGAHRRAQNQ